MRGSDTPVNEYIDNPDSEDSARRELYTWDDMERGPRGEGYGTRRADYEEWSRNIPIDLELDYERDGYRAPGGNSRSSYQRVDRTGTRSGADSDSDPRRSRRSASRSSYARDARGRGRRRYRRMGWRRVIRSVAVVLIAVIAVAAIAWQILVTSGRASLRKNSSVIHLVGEDGTVYENWEDDWVAYNGRVYDYNEDILTFLLMGIDKTSELEPGDDAYDGGSADALYLVVMDQSAKEISLLYINRYTMVDVYVYDEEDNLLYTQEMQICMQHYVGDGLEKSAEREVRVVSELLYDLSINGYASINMSAIPLFNDAVGGVTLEALEDVPVLTKMTQNARDSSISTYDESEITRDLVAGETYTLTGMEAYYYLKYRNVYQSMSSYGRADRQKQYIKLFVEQMLSAVKSDLTVALDLYEALSSYMVTDINVSEFTYLISEILDGYTFNLDEFYQIEGELLTDDTDSGYYELYPDEDALFELMLDLFYNDVTEKATGEAT